jgi:hypothetical protein
MNTAKQASASRSRQRRGKLDIQKTINASKRPTWGPKSLDKPAVDLTVNASLNENKLEGSNGTIKIAVTPNLSAIYSTCAALVYLGIIKGMNAYEDLANKGNQVLQALQQDLIGAMQSATPISQRAPQFWWNLRDALQAKQIKTSQGNFSFEWNTGNLVPITTGTANGTYFGNLTGGITNGLVNMQVDGTAPANPADILANFWAFICEGACEQVQWTEATHQFAKDPSAFAYKVDSSQGLPSAHTVDGLPLHAICCLEVPIQSFWCDFGFASNIDARLSKFHRHSEGGAAMATITEWWIMCKTERKAPGLPMSYQFAVKFIDMDWVLQGLFAQLVQANLVSANASQAELFDPGFDAVGFCLYALNSAVFLLGTDSIAAIGLSFNGSNVVVGTPNINVGTAQTINLPAWFVESFKSLNQTWYKGNQFIFPVLSVSPTIISQLAAIYTQFNWTSWGGNSLNLQTSSIGPTVVSTAPTSIGGDDLSLTFNNFSGALNAAGNILMIEQAAGLHQWSLMYATRVYKSTPVESAKRVMGMVLKRFKHKEAKIESEIEYMASNKLLALTNGLDDIYSRMPFPVEFNILDGSLILPNLFYNTFANPQQYYTYGNHVTYINNQTNSTVLTQSASDAVKFISNPNVNSGSEVIQKLKRRMETGQGGAAEAIAPGSELAKHVDSLINSGGPVVKAINWGLGKAIAWFRGRIRR